jgi:hypothetical protein
VGGPLGQLDDLPFGRGKDFQSGISGCNSGSGALAQLIDRLVVTVGVMVEEG